VFYQSANAQPRKFQQNRNSKAQSLLSSHCLKTRKRFGKEDLKKEEAITNQTRHISRSLVYTASPGKPELINLQSTFFGNCHF
jgi:hypothetical protein